MAKVILRLYFLRIVIWVWMKNSYSKWYLSKPNSFR